MIHNDAINHVSHSGEFKGLDVLMGERYEIVSQKTIIMSMHIMY